MVGQNALGLGGANMGGLTNHRVAIWPLGGENQRQNRLILQVPRLILVPLQLLNHRALLLLEFVFAVDAKVADTVGLNFQSLFPAVGCEIEMEGGHILRGESIVCTPVFQSGAVNVSRHQLVGALEHEVFEVMGQASLVQ